MAYNNIQFGSLQNSVKEYWEFYVRQALLGLRLFSNVAAAMSDPSSTLEQLEVAQQLLNTLICSISNVYKHRAINTGSIQIKLRFIKLITYMLILLHFVKMMWLSSLVAIGAIILEFS